MGAGSLALVRGPLSYLKVACQGPVGSGLWVPGFLSFSWWPRYQGQNDRRLESTIGQKV